MSVATVMVLTTLGRFTIALHPEAAPHTVKNFLDYCKAGHFEQTIFHRVIPGFMIQGGGYNVKWQEKPTQAPIRNEANNGLSNRRGTVAMARTQDPHSATSQFFINLVDNSFLDFTSATSAGWGYAVFGEVVEGLDIVDKIAQQPTQKRGLHENVPTTPIVILSTTVHAVSDKEGDCS